MTPTTRKDDFGKVITCEQCDAPRLHHKAGTGKRAKTWITCSEDCSLSEPDPRDTPQVQTATALKKSRCSKRGAKDKGNRGEREIVTLAKECGFDAYRTAGSGAHGTNNNEAAFATDVRMLLRDPATRAELLCLRVESKLKATISGLKSLTNDMAGSDALRVRQDNQEGFWLLREKHVRLLLSLSAEALLAKSKREA